VKDFVCVLPGKIFFGPSMGQALFALDIWKGRRVVLLSSADGAKEGGHLDIVEAMIKDVAPVVSYLADAEPSYAWLQTALALVKARSGDLIVAVGGQRAFEAAKWLAVLASGGADSNQLLEQLGSENSRNGSLGSGSIAPLPYIAIPTRATLASQNDCGTVLFHRDERRIVTLRHMDLLPKAVWLNPSFCLTDVSQDEAASVVAANLGRVQGNLAPSVGLDVSTRTNLQGLFRASYQLGMAPNSYDNRAELLWLSAVVGLDLYAYGHGPSWLQGATARAAALCTLMLPKMCFTRCLAECTSVFLAMLTESEELRQENQHLLRLLMDSLSANDFDEGLGRSLDFFYSRLGQLQTTKQIASFYPGGGIDEVLSKLRASSCPVVQDFLTEPVELILKRLAS
jgi:alcohol dehydrogenase YqhD (iron-dependent ADH family)